MKLRLGIDVGGTNTDAVVLDERDRLVAKAKTPTTSDVSSGIEASLRLVLERFGGNRSAIRYCMLGTTHCINAILERKGLDRVAIVRIGTPASDAVPPLTDWPKDLAAAVTYRSYRVAGGNEFDGRPMAPLDRSRLETFARRFDGRVKAVAITSVFSPVRPEQEVEAGRIITRTVRHPVSVSLSHEIATIGLLERENATVLNAALGSVSRKAVVALRDVTRRLGLRCTLYLGQNDGTLMDVESALRQPILTVASGPTNSIRGASTLARVQDAVVIDVGGTSTDIGLLKDGFPLESARPSSLGGVRTNFRMPDVLSLALGGGSRVRGTSSVAIGPDSVGYRLTTESRVFGGTSLTATDVAVARGRSRIGDPTRVRSLSPHLVAAADRLVQTLVEDGIDRVRTSSRPLPAVLVGGGSVLLGNRLKGASRILRPPNYEVANAIGVATAEIGADVDTIVTYGTQPREQALDRVRQLAIQRAIRSGADPRRIRIANVEEIPVTYLPGNAVRVRVKACGALRRGGGRNR